MKSNTFRMNFYDDLTVSYGFSYDFLIGEKLLSSTPQKKNIVERRLQPNGCRGVKPSTGVSFRTGRQSGKCGRGLEPRDGASILNVHLAVVARSPGKMFRS